MSVTIPLSDEQTRKVSDGYHTFEELYGLKLLKAQDALKGEK